MEWISINQKRNRAKVDHDDDSKSEQLPPKKKQIYMSVIISCLDFGLFLYSFFYRFSIYNCYRQTLLPING